MLRIILLICLTVAVAVFGYIYEVVWAGPSPLRVGMDFTNPPFQTLKRLGTKEELEARNVPVPDEKDSKYHLVDGVYYEDSGFSVDLAEALAQKLGRPLKIVVVRFQELADKLRNHDIDIILSSYTINDQRKQLMEFSDGYAQSGIGFIVDADSDIGKNLKENYTLDDLIKQINGLGGSVTVRDKTAAAAFLTNKDGVRPARISLTQESALAEKHIMDDLKAVYANDHCILYRWAVALPHRTRLIPVTASNLPWGIGARKGDVELLRQINAALKDFKAEKKFQEIAAKYDDIVEYQEYLKENHLPPLLLDDPRN